MSSGILLTDISLPLVVYSRQLRSLSLLSLHSLLPRLLCVCPALRLASPGRPAVQGPTPASMGEDWPSHTPLAQHTQSCLSWTRGTHRKVPGAVLLPAGGNPQPNPAAPSPGLLCYRDNVMAKADLKGDGHFGDGELLASPPAGCLLETSNQPPSRSRLVEMGRNT